jgi:hypothetical protein
MAPMIRLAWQAATLLFAQPSAAALPADRGPGLRLGTEVAYERGFAGAPSYGSVGWNQALDVASGALELAGGFRLAIGRMTPSPRGAAFVRSSLCARQGSYRPAIGLELEVTATARAVPASDEPQGSLTRAFARENADNVLRTAVVVAPARFQWRHLFLSVGGLRLIVPVLRDPGARAHLGVAFVDIGWRL